MVQQEKTYNTLEDIVAEKERLHKALTEKCEEISALWGELVHPQENEGPKSPAQRILQYANAGAGLVDGVLLGWKLYRRIGGTFSFFKKKKR